MSSLLANVSVVPGYLNPKSTQLELLVMISLYKPSKKVAIWALARSTDLSKEEELGCSHLLAHRKPMLHRGRWNLHLLALLTSMWGKSNTANLKKPNT